MIELAVGREVETFAQPRMSAACHDDKTLLKEMDGLKVGRQGRKEAESDVDITRGEGAKRRTTDGRSQRDACMRRHFARRGDERPAQQRADEVVTYCGSRTRSCSIWPRSDLSVAYGQTTSVRSWMRRTASSGTLRTGILSAPCCMSPSGWCVAIPSPTWRQFAKGTEAFHRVAMLDGQLQRRKFVTGETLTVADFWLGSALNLADIAR
jgi:hypothetical protein